MIWRLVAVAVLPFATLSIYLVFSRWPARWFTTGSDYAGGAVSVLAGLALIFRLPVDTGSRIALAICHVIIISIFLFFYGLWFVGVFFGDGL